MTARNLFFFIVTGQLLLSCCEANDSNTKAFPIGAYHYLHAGEEGNAFTDGNGNFSYATFSSINCIWEEPYENPGTDCDFQRWESCSQNCYVEYGDSRLGYELSQGFQAMSRFYLVNSLGTYTGGGGSETITLNGINYEDVSCFEPTDTNTTELREFCAAKNFGIIKMRFADGVTWEKLP